MILNRLIIQIAKDHFPKIQCALTTNQDMSMTDIVFALKEELLSKQRAVSHLCQTNKGIWYGK